MAKISVTADELYTASLEKLCDLEKSEIEYMEIRIQRQMRPQWNRWYHVSESTARKELGIPDGVLTYPFTLLDPTVYRLFKFSEAVVGNGWHRKEIILNDFEYMMVFG